jgi:putative ABC transport system permease protein
VAEARDGLVRVNGSQKSLSGVDAQAMEEAYDPEFVAGGWSDLKPGGVAVLEGTAEDLGVGVGDTIPVQFSRVGIKDLRVDAIYEGSEVGELAIPMSDYVRDFSEQSDILMFVNGKPGADPIELSEQVEDALADYPTLTVRNQAEYKQYIEDQVNSFLGLIYALLALAIVIAIFGIVNTLALSIFERTREIGLLRAVGMSARQARRMVRWESVIVALIGGLLGVVLGVIFGVVGASATPDLDAVSIPIVRIVIFFVLAGLAGVLAAVWPARRAARLNVLQAIAHQ